MDKQLLKAYIRTVVEDEVRRLLPELLTEAVNEVKQLSENTQPKPAPKFDRTKLASLMNLDYDRENGTLTATTDGVYPETHMNTAGVNPKVVAAIERDYSEVMKAMKANERR